MSSLCVGKKSSAAAIRRCYRGEAAARMSGGGCEAKSLCPNAQTKTHVSMSLQSHFAVHGHYTTPCPSHSVCAAKHVPTTRVTPVRPTEAATASCKATCGNQTVGMQGPDTHTGAVQEWDATPTNIFARAGVQRRPALACSRREEQACGRNTGAGMQRTQRWPAPHFHHIATCMHGRGSLARVTDRCAQPLGGGVPGCRGRVTRNLFILFAPL
jgi:hypothetical protein